jgi:DNA-binding transcriptional LysR family regulator
MLLHQLRYFISVAEHLNFSEAAKHLYVAQSAVSQQIANLEEKLGVKLFTRNKRSVQLTSAGSVFLKEALEIVTKTDEAIVLAKKAQAGLIGTIKIGFLAGPTREFLPKIIKQFHRKYPSIEIKLKHLTLSQLNESLKTDELDIVFAISFGFQGIEGLEHQRLFSESNCVFMNRQHPLASKDCIHPSLLSQETFIMRVRDEAPQWYDFTLSLCAKNGFSPQIVSQTERIETVIMLVDAGLGITILPKYLEMYATPSITIIPLAGETNTVDIVVYRKSSNSNPAIPLFYEEMNSLLQTSI